MTLVMSPLFHPQRCHGPPHRLKAYLLPLPGAAVLVSSAVCLWIDRFVTLKIELPLGMGHSVIWTALYQEEPTGVFLIAQWHNSTHYILIGDLCQEMLCWKHVEIIVIWFSITCSKYQEACCTFWNIPAFWSSLQRRSSWPWFGWKIKWCPCLMRSHSTHTCTVCSGVLAGGTLHSVMGTRRCDSHCVTAPKEGAGIGYIWTRPVSYNSDPWPIWWKNESLGVVIYLESIKAL